MLIFNYTVRVLIVIIGAAFCFGFLKLPNSEPIMMQVMGAVMMLWGLYRIVRFRSKLKDYERDEE